MFRKFVIFPILLAWLASAIPLLIPHHHHQALICTAVEACSQDCCTHDEHPHHTHSPEDEAFCLAHEGYRPSETVSVDRDKKLSIPVFLPAAASGGGLWLSDASGASAKVSRANPVPSLLPVPSFLPANAPHAPPFLFS